MLVIDAKHLILKQSPIGLFIFLFDLLAVFFWLLALDIVLVNGARPLCLGRRNEGRAVELLLDSLTRRVVPLHAAFTNKSISLTHWFLFWLVLSKMQVKFLILGQIE